MTNSLVVLADGAFAMLKKEMASNWPHPPSDTAEFLERLRLPLAERGPASPQSSLVNNRLLSIGQTAQALAVSPRTIRAWIKAGAVPCIKVRSTVRIAEQDVLALRAKRLPHS